MLCSQVYQVERNDFSCMIISRERKVPAAAQQPDNYNEPLSHTHKPDWGSARSCFCSALNVKALTQIRALHCSKVVIFFSCGRKIMWASVSMLTGPSIMQPFRQAEGRRDDMYCLDTGTKKFVTFRTLTRPPALKH